MQRMLKKMNRGSTEYTRPVSFDSDGTEQIEVFIIPYAENGNVLTYTLKGGMTEYSILFNY